MAGGIVIQAIRDEHIEGFRTALDIVSRERKYLAMLEAPSLERMEAFVRESVSAGNVHVVAVADTEVVGWCDIRRLERGVHSHRGTLGMGIIPGFRDRGIGHQLIKAALEAARETGMHRIELDVNVDNPRAIALYEKVGFTHEGVARDAKKIDGQFIDSARMAMIFGA